MLVFSLAVCNCLTSLCWSISEQTGFPKFQFFCGNSSFSLDRKVENVSCVRWIRDRDLHTSKQKTLERCIKLFLLHAWTKDLIFIQSVTESFHKKQTNFNTIYTEIADTYDIETQTNKSCIPWHSIIISVILTLQVVSVSQTWISLHEHFFKNEKQVEQRVGTFCCLQILDLRIRKDSVCENFDFRGHL